MTAPFTLEVQGGSTTSRLYVLQSSLWVRQAAQYNLVMTCNAWGNGWVRLWHYGQAVTVFETRVDGGSVCFKQATKQPIPIGIDPDHLELQVRACTGGFNVGPTQVFFHPVVGDVLANSGSDPVVKVPRTRWERILSDDW